MHTVALVIKNQTHKRFKRKLFIRTKTQFANFQSNPLRIQNSNFKIVLEQILKIVSEY